MSGSREDYHEFKEPQNPNLAINSQDPRQENEKILAEKIGNSVLAYNKTWNKSL